MKASIRMLVLALLGLSATAAFAEEKREAGRSVADAKPPVQVVVKPAEGNFAELLELERERQKAELEKLKAEYGRADNPLLVSNF